MLHELVGPSVAERNLAEHGDAISLDRRVLSVESGSAEIYLEGDGSARRGRLFAIQAGEAAIAPLFEDGGTRLVAFLTDEHARASLVEPEAFLARLDAGDEDAIAGAEAWIARLAGFLANPVGGKPGWLAAGSETLPVGIAARPASGLLWVAAEQGSIVPGCLRAEPVSPGDPPIPVFAGPGGNIAALDHEARITCRTSVALAAEGGLSRAFLAYQRNAGRALADERRAAAEQETAFIAGKRAHDRDVLAACIEPLAGVQDSDRAGRDRLAAAFRQVAEASGVQWPESGSRPASSGLSAPVDRRIAELARYARVGLRRVRLDADWWRRGGQSLLAFRRDDGTPVALIAGTGWRSGYRMRVGGALRAVHAREAEGLDPDAFALQRRLPDEPITGRTLLAFARPLAAPVLLPVLILAAAGSALGLVTPIASGILFETVIPAASRTELVQLTLGIAGLGLGAIMFELVRGFLLLRLSSVLDTDLEGAIWDRLLHLPASFFRRYPAGDLALRASAINQMRDAMSGTVIGTLLSAVVSISSLGLILTYGWRLAAMAVALVAVQIVIMVAVSLRLLAWKRRALDTEGRLQALALQLIQAIAKLKVAGAETRAFTRWAPLLMARNALERRQHTLSAGFSAFGTAFGTAATGVMIALIGLGGLKIGVGDFVSFSAAYGQFIAATLSLGSALPAVLSLKPLYARAKPLLQAVPDEREAGGAPLDLVGRVEVRNLVFRYRPEGPAVLDGVTIEAEPGSFVALVGASGSGKSTLMRLLLGFEKAAQGTIAFDGHDLAGLDARILRRQMGVVLQNSRILNGTVLDNIRNGAILSEAEVWDAAHLAGFDTDIRAMPMGLHTFVGEDASLLSGGQRQRLLIARALVRRPRVLLFDEATSALDNRTQQTVTERLSALDATRIVVAHRLSTVEKADRIYVLDGGRVIEQGSYVELMAAGGTFASLARRQIA